MDDRKVRGTKKGHFQTSKEGDTELLSLGGLTLASGDNSQVVGRKVEIFQTSHERMLHILGSVDDWVNLFICYQEENSQERTETFPFYPAHYSHSNLPCWSVCAESQHSIPGCLQLQHPHKYQMKSCSQRVLCSPAPEESAPNERLQSINELAKLSSSFTELDLTHLALRQGSPVSRGECVCMSANIIYLSSSKKQRLIMPSPKRSFYTTSALHSMERRDLPGRMSMTHPAQIPKEPNFEVNNPP